MSFTGPYFVNNLIIPLARQHAQQRVDIACRRLHLNLDNSNGHNARDVQEEMVSQWCVRLLYPPYSPDLAIADLYMFGRLKQQLSGRTLDSEQNVLETVTEILGVTETRSEKCIFALQTKMPVGFRP
jgi:hypothetical protein